MSRNGRVVWRSIILTALLDSTRDASWWGTLGMVIALVAFTELVEEFSTKRPEAREERG